MFQLKRGFLVTLEGIDGAGKTTLANSIQSHCVKYNIPVTLTREPGATSLGKHIRTLILDKSLQTASRAEFLLFAADRAQHIAEVVKPALAQHTIVISDRMADSSVVYQGFGRGLDIPFIQAVNSWALNETQPDLVFYVKISLATALERIKKRNQELTAFEEQEAFTKKIIAGFDEIFAHRKNVVVLDGEKSATAVAHDALTHLIKYLEMHA